MKKNLCFIIYLLIAIQSFALNLGNWEYYEKDDFQVFYPKGYEYHAMMTLSALIEYKEDVQKITGNNKNVKTRIIIQDLGQYLNGYADNIEQKIGIYTNPPLGEGAFASTNNWFRIVGIHEYTHIMQLSNSSDLAGLISKIYGNAYSPNQVVPMWIVEGITVYEESQITDTEGRMNGGYYDKIIAIKALKDEMPNVLEANYIHETYPMGQYYVYGGSFFTFLSENYGKAKIAEFFEKNGKQWWVNIFGVGYVFPFIGIDNEAKKVFGKDFTQLFKEWEISEKNKVKDLKIIREKIEKNIDKMLINENCLYYEKTEKQTVSPFNYRNYYEIVKYDLDKKSKKVLETLNTSLLMKMKIRDGKIYYVVGNLKREFSNIDQNGYGLKSKLYSIDLKTGKKELIIKDTFYDFEIDKNNKIYLLKRKKENYSSKIVFLENGNEKTIYNTEDMISQIVLFNDELYIVSKSEFSSWDIKKIKNGLSEDILNTYLHEYNIEIRDENIYFNSAYTKKMGYYRYNIKSKEMYEIDLGVSGLEGLEYKGEFYFKGIDTDGEHLYKKKYAEKLLKDITDKYKKENREVLTYKKLDLEAKKSFWQNYKYLLMPGQRNPFYISGEDALGINSYSIWNSLISNEKETKIKTDFTFTSKILSPVILTYTYFDESIMSAKVPLYQSLEKGVTNISASISKDSETYYPKLSINCLYPKLNIFLSQSIDVENTGDKKFADLTYYMGKGKMKISYMDFNDFKTTVGRNGFGTYSEYNGIKSEAELKLKTLSIKKGMWNPNIFIGDIYSKVFYQNDSIERGRGYEKKYYGYGFEMELSAAMYMNLVLDCEFVYSDNNGSFLNLMLRYPY